MSQIEINGNPVRYRVDGAADAPVLILSNSLGTTLEMWDTQMPALTPHFRVLRYDTRGHGGSRTTPGEYSAPLLGGDVLALADALDIGTFSYCGLSMGGAIGQWLGLNAGPRLSKLVLCNTAAKIGSVDGWNARIDMVRRDGMAEVASGAIARWFTPEFAAAEPQQVEVVRQQLLGCDPAGYAANCAVVRDADFRGQLGAITAPLLFIAGARDPVTSVADGAAVVAEVRGSRLVVLDAAHLSNIGARAAFDAALLEFLRS
ncbi:3-oxoadipate enol-lactonase [Hydrocarboniphaga sp.]|uniref:3-oxoadipate enol-lactonase n=1 Tax=Hydrocarboniphaga sp. TaxID=2033016 RepID=UPI003D14F9AC